MKTIIYTTLIACTTIMYSCNKYEKPISSSEVSKFNEPTDPKEIDTKVKMFIAKTKMSIRESSNNVDINECVWLVEAGLNYTFAELDKGVSDFLTVKDSILLDLESNQLLNDEACVNFYENFRVFIQNLKNNDSLFICRMVDVEYRNNYLVAEILYGEYDASELNRDASLSEFTSDESYYAYTSAYYNPNPVPAPLPGPFNAAKKVEAKLRFRNNILYLPAGSYFTNLTIWSPHISPISDYYNEFCMSNTLKLWGTPGHDAVYKGHVENTMLNYTYLNFILDEADNWINYTPPPTGKQVSHIEYKATHAGEVLNPDYFTPCLGTYEFFYYFRWKYGTLVIPRE